MDVTVDKQTEYTLLDSGEGRKLEQVGDVIIDRPSPQAIWRRSRQGLWKRAGARFDRKEGGTGEWRFPDGPIPESWWVSVFRLRFEVRLTGFGNIGLFPEHGAHFQWLTDRIGTRQFVS